MPASSTKASSARKSSTASGAVKKSARPPAPAKKPAAPKNPDLEFANRKDLRAWLKLNAAASKGTWIFTPSRESGLPRVTPEELLEELLCFGWVDGETEKVGTDRVKTQCSPRKPKAPWTRVQKEKIKKLTTLRMMTPAGQAMVDLAKRTGAWDAPEATEDLKEPLDLRSALSGTTNARDHWESFDRSTRREIVEWILASKTVEIRERRILETVTKAAKNIAVTPKP
jgi:uncharacterized protein YdeI (YjbR/CyaY-like superfamily)